MRKSSTTAFGVNNFAKCDHSLPVHRQKTGADAIDQVGAVSETHFGHIGLRAPSTRTRTMGDVRGKEAIHGCFPLTNKDELEVENHLGFGIQLRDHG